MDRTFIARPIVPTRTRRSNNLMYRKPGRGQWLTNKREYEVPVRVRTATR